MIMIDKDKKNIEYKDISVVVQGAIENSTALCLESIRKNLPQAVIILSTWEHSDVDALASLYDKIVFNKDPGTIPHYDDVKDNKSNNLNRQIVSTINGLKEAKTPYAIKIRTNFYFENVNFLQYFDKYNAFNENLRKVKKKMLACTIYSRNPKNKKKPFAMYLSDFFFFGLTEDVYNLFNIPLMTDEEGFYFKENKAKKGRKSFKDMNKFHPEQYIWLHFLNYKYCENFMDNNDRAIIDTQISFANNVVLLSPQQLGINSLKKRVFIKGHPQSCYSYYDWLCLYYRYCVKTHIPIYIYFLMFFLFLKKNVWQVLMEYVITCSYQEHKTVIKILKIPVYHTKYYQWLKKMWKG